MAGAVGGHDLLGQLFQCSAADALGLLCAFQFAVGNGAVGIHGQGGGDSTAKAFGRAGLSHTGSGGAAAAAAGGQRDANNEAHGHGSAQFADDLLFHGSFLQRKIGLCSVPRKCHIFSRMFTKDNIFCEVLSRDFSTYFVKNDKLVSICDADGIKKAGNQRAAVGSRQTEALRRNSTLDVVVHVHQVADGAYFVGDVGIAWMVCLMALLATAKLIISMAL